MMNNLIRYTCCVVTILLTGCVSTSVPDSRTSVAVRGAQITINGQPETLFGFRAGSAALREDWTRQVIGQLGEWQRHGVNAFTLWLQGTSGAYHRVFTADGQTLANTAGDVIARVGYGLKEMPAAVANASGQDIAARTRRIVEAADAHGMVVVIGIGYRSSWNEADTPDLVERAMRAAVIPFRDYRNVIFNVWNEINTSHALEGPAQIERYVSAIRAAAPGRLVCAGSLQSAMNLQLAKLQGLDLFCQDAGRNYKDTIAAFDALAPLGKPIINVESYGGNGGGYVDYRERAIAAPAGYAVDFSAQGGWRRVYGVWEEPDYKDATGRPLMGRRSYLDLIRHVGNDASRQRHLFVHVAGWFQGASRVESPAQLNPGNASGTWGNVFHTGHQTGDGTVASPGIGWILREIRAARSRHAMR